MKKNNHTEIESKLLVIAKRPKDFLEQISRKSIVIHYKLIKIGRQKIRDIYLDSTDDQLKQQRLALRLRKINHHFFLTLKGKTQMAKWGGVSRLEIELPYSLSALKKIDEILKQNNISFNLFAKKSVTENPLTFLQHAPLKIIQDRETSRRIRHIVSQEHSEKILAEMALDTVTYRLTNLTIHQAEIELEAKSSAGIEAIQHIHNFLLQTNPDKLRIWTLSKLTTGLLLEKISQKENLQSYLDNQNYLLPEIYELILKNFEHFIIGAVDESF